jgi:cell division protein FtsW (lipid II flippase)
MVMGKRSKIKLDLTFLVAMLTLVAVGLVAIYSATYTMGGGRHALFYKQIIWLVSGFLLLALTVAIDYRKLEQWGTYSTA